MFEISDFFPEISAIEDENLRGSIKDCWVIACRENNIKDLSKVPWLPPVQKDLNIKNESLVNHVRDVVSLSVGIADSLKDSRNTDIDYDLLIGGCLIHDISKLYEFDGMKETDTYRLLGHPYYGIYCVSKAGLPIEYSHIVLSYVGL